MTETYKSRVYTDRPAYADFDAPAKFQAIHPYMFAESAADKEQYVTKATCLWLVNLPRLKTNGLPKPDNGKLFGKLPSGKNRTWEDTYSRCGKVRSKTFPGIAEAMAEQGGGLPCE